mgnify:CR=1 FL=1
MCDALDVRTILTIDTHSAASAVERLRSTDIRAVFKILRALQQQRSDGPEGAADMYLPCVGLTIAEFACGYILKGESTTT